MVVSDKIEIILYIITRHFHYKIENSSISIPGVTKQQKLQTLSLTDVESSRV